MEGQPFSFAENSQAISALTLMQYLKPEQLPWLLRTTSQRKCAQCGAELIASDWSEHLSEQRVRNVWSCKACGYQFEDMVCLRTR
jgi:DNA-directed RNA polymerase subunit RPC12/RpoP